MDKIKDCLRSFEKEQQGKTKQSKTKQNKSTARESILFPVGHMRV